MGETELDKLCRELSQTKEEVDSLRASLSALMDAHEGLAYRVLYDRAARADIDTKSASAELANARWISPTQDGWVVALDNSSARWSLPSHLKIEVTREDSDRQYFVVSEGIHRNSKGSIRKGNVANESPHAGAAALLFEPRSGSPIVVGGVSYDRQLTITRAGGFAVGPFPAKTAPSNPLPAGQHVVQIPDFPHPDGVRYGPRGTVWFRIGTAGDRYVHAGRVSAGCLTCAPGNWPTIYDALVVSRAGDLQSIGVLTVR
jgi:hypothetical protein